MCVLTCVFSSASSKNQNTFHTLIQFYIEHTSMAHTFYTLFYTHCAVCVKPVFPGCHRTVFPLNWIHPGESGGSRTDLFYLTSQISCCICRAARPAKPVKPLKEFKLAHMRRSRASEASDRLVTNQSPHKRAMVYLNGH